MFEDLFPLFKEIYLLPLFRKIYFLLLGFFFPLNTNVLFFFLKSRKVIL